MRWLKGTFALLLVIALMVVGIEFFWLNSGQQVTIKFIYGSTSAELSWVLFFAFFGGALLTLLVGAFTFVPLHWRIRRLRDTVASQEQQINTLNRKLNRGARPA
jgi:uncharacterized membrane protein YciS (DUF1049 family)